MRIDDLASNDLVIREMGARVRDARIAFPLTQAELAQRAGVSTRTIANLERGHDVALGSLVSTLRALGLLSRFDMLVPEHELRPTEMRPETPKRQRVRASKARRAADASAWKWGDE